MTHPVPSVEDVQAAVEALRSKGFDAVWIDRAPVFDKVTLLHALYQSIPLPSHFGFNWDALQDALYESHVSGRRVLVFRDIEQLEARDPATAATFIDIVETVAADPRSGLHGVHRVRAEGT